MNDLYTNIFAIIDCAIPMIDEKYKENMVKRIIEQIERQTPREKVKSVSILDDDGNLKYIPLDRVIIEREKEGKVNKNFKIGNLVLVSDCPGIIVREPYSIGCEPKLTLCRVLMNNSCLSEPKIEDVVETGIYYPGFANAIKNMKRFIEKEGDLNGKRKEV